MCRDVACVQGIISCRGCNGHGVVNPKGKRYRVKCKAIPDWAVAHVECNGTGMRACGCRELDELERDVLAGRAQFPAAEWVNA